MSDNTIKDINGNSTNVYANSIYAFIDSFINDPNNDIDNIYKLSQGRWSYVLMCCNDALNININLKLKNDNDKCIYNQYDIDKVNDVLNIYIALCSQYDKIITISGFCNMTGITRETLHEWDRDDNANSPRSDIHKKLSDKFQDTLDDGLFSGKVTPIVGIAYKNNTVWKDSQIDTRSGEPKKGIAQIAAELGVKDQTDTAPQALPDAEF